MNLLYVRARFNPRRPDAAGSTRARTSRDPASRIILTKFLDDPGTKQLRNAHASIEWLLQYHFMTLNRLQYEAHRLAFRHPEAPGSREKLKEWEALLRDNKFDKEDDQVEEKMAPCGWFLTSGSRITCRKISQSSSGAWEGENLHCLI